MRTYYNDNERYVCDWLSNLMDAGAITPGVIDDRDIRDVRSDDLRGFDRVHLFAGLGVWDYAARLAGVPDDWAFWTASCPCPPFSAAGKRKACPECGSTSPVPCPRRTGFFICVLCEHAWEADERHLWPEVWRLVRDLRPRLLFGEQVASGDGRTWLASVRASLQIMGFTTWGADLCSAGVGSPNIRQRLFFVSEAVGDTLGTGLEGHGGHGNNRDQPGRQREGTRRPTPPTGATRRLADADGRDASEERKQRGREHRLESDHGRSFEDLATGTLHGFWQDADWLFCRDGKWRPVEPGAFPLADGVTDRVGKLRAYGNAINPEVAAEFIHAYRDSVSNGTLRDWAADLI